jgi:hypothetical protein
VLGKHYFSCQISFHTNFNIPALCSFVPGFPNQAKSLGKGLREPSLGPSDFESSSPHALPTRISARLQRWSLELQDNRVPILPTVPSAD